MKATKKTMSSFNQLSAIEMREINGGITVAVKCGDGRTIIITV